MAEAGKLQPWERLYRYWLSRHVDGRPPARADIDPPVDIPQLAKNLMLLKKTEDGDFYYRLAGTEIEERALMSLTGKKIGVSKITSEVERNWRAGLNATTDEAAPRLYIARLPAGTSAEYVTLMLPLVHPDGTPDQVLVGCFFDGALRSDIQVEGMIALPIDIGV